MAHVHGKNCYFTIEDGNAASQSMGGDGTDIDLTFTSEHPDESGFGDIGEQLSASATETWKLTLTYLYNNSASANADVLEGLRQKSTVFVLGPNGSTASLIKYTACGVVLDNNITFAKAGLVGGKATFGPNSGSLTKTVFP